MEKLFILKGFNHGVETAGATSAYALNAKTAEATYMDKGRIMITTPLQDKVIKRAKELIQNEPWYRGICLDHLPSAKEIERDGIEESAQQLAMDTAWWDAWDHKGFMPTRKGEK